MSQVAVPSDLETVIDLRVASGGVPQGQLKLVKRYIDGKIDYTVFTGDEHVAILEATTEQDAIYEGLTKIREFLKYLNLKDSGLLDSIPLHLVEEEEKKTIEDLDKKVEQQFQQLEDILKFIKHPECEECLSDNSFPWRIKGTPLSRWLCRDCCENWSY